MVRLKLVIREDLYLFLKLPLYCAFFVLNRDEDPVGNWTLRIIDAFNPQETGKLIHWTLTLWGEIAPDMTGEPNHRPVAGALPTSTAASSSATSTTHSVETTSASPVVTASQSDTTTDATSSAAEPAQTTNADHIDAELESSPAVNGTNVPERIVSTGSTVAYISVGSILILAAASIAYVAKRKAWAEKGYREPPMSTRTEGYEFDLFVDDEGSEEEEEEDDLDDGESHAESPMLGRDKGKGKMVHQTGADSP